MAFAASRSAFFRSVAACLEPLGLGFRVARSASQLDAPAAACLRSAAGFLRFFFLAAFAAGGAAGLSGCFLA